MCAEVRIEIKQELTLERQGFDAMLRLDNGYPEDVLSNVVVQVKFTDTEDHPVAATSDPNNTNASFFIRVDSLQGISAASNGVVAPAAAAEMHWLIVPSYGAGGTNALGRQYCVGASLSCDLRGRRYEVEVEPDRIRVKPMPRLKLDYFLPGRVYGDDPYTTNNEESVVFSLGVRVNNTGAGVGRDLKIESSQPYIKQFDNPQGLWVGFRLRDCEVHGVSAPKTLCADLGTIPPGGARVARWNMTASLMGEFVYLEASFKHADGLGGELTSLMEAIGTHLLIRDVLVDWPGRDDVRDFLAGTPGLCVYESDGVDTLVLNFSSNATLTLQGLTTNAATYLFEVPTSAVPFYAMKSMPEIGGKEVYSAVRVSDGKLLNPANAWISKTRDRGTDPWNYEFHLFDVGGGGSYLVKFQDRPDVENRCPVLAPIVVKVALAGETLAFQVEASDPDGTTPGLGVAALPATAAYQDNMDGTGSFSWQPQESDYGVHPVRFVASDGQYEDWEIVKVYVGHAGEAMCHGIPCSLTDWTVSLSNLLAYSSSGNATLVWNSVTGLLYAAYYSDNPYAGWWTAIGGQQVGAGGASYKTDAGLGTNRMKRFYQVVFAGDAPNTNNVWGVIRRDAAPGYTLISPPVRTDRRLDGELGAALAAVLQGNDGGLGSGADELYILQEDGSWRVLYLDASGVWREASGAVSEYELPKGRGLWVARKVGALARFTFTGPVGNDGTRTNRIVTGWNLLGLSEGKDLPLKATLASANPVSGGSEESADQLVIQNPDGSWRRLMYVEGWGAPYDGNWFDLQSFTIVSTNEVLEPGQAYYYLRRGSATEIQF